MDFFARQAEARRQTRWFVVIFVLAVLLVVVGLDLLIFTAFGIATADIAGPFQVRHEPLTLEAK